MPTTATILIEAVLVLERNGLHQSDDPFDRFQHATGCLPAACRMGLRGAIAHAATGTPEAAILHLAHPDAAAALRQLAAHLHLDPARIDDWNNTPGLNSARAAEVMRRAAACGRWSSGE